MRLLALDPGIRGSGVAVFEAGELVDARYVKSPGTGDGLSAVYLMAVEVLHVTPRPFYLAAERMQVYTQGNRKGDPNDLIPLAAVVGAVAQAAVEAQWYRPREWKGTIPKGEAFEARVTERLSETERSIIKSHGALTHNVYDAIGIGLFHLGRFSKRRVIAR